MRSSLFKAKTIGLRHTGKRNAAHQGYAGLSLTTRPAPTAGVNNIFDRDPPQCFTCDSANFDPTTYDLPGQFGYLRLSYGF